MKNFLATGAGIDRNVGRIRDFLREHDLAENTIVIYMADHGFFLGEHGFFDKRFMYEESLRTAFIVHWPGVVEYGVVNDTDIFIIIFTTSPLSSHLTRIPSCNSHTNINIYNYCHPRYLCHNAT